MNGPIGYRNQNYLRSTREPVKPHLIAEDFDQVQIVAAAHQARIDALEKTVQQLQLKLAGKS